MKYKIFCVLGRKTKIDIPRKYDIHSFRMINVPKK